ncbi:DUF427 domain-containing protein [Candidatus Lucifugimonas marina]|jgi:uncharacterized protein (DUF427 family)|uniref:DUF427 domain-containing protein n=1 Tax=Candidatus Lucifugimonas marina TaxID=3038979 RepID=A0AAJ5ZJZ0_9CHLR|nr:DUF427 domain-containing protein [SAR202 cluster bacterium JH702]MDG0870289.1 DUF427 domain-containing protein [SAR202 cluster bacterium JH639]WFG36151.1 DUF427 domain-containing protein [SAR202 cluster bacterium JH545]WFG40097.1 DUF427 domain-containing protein [SAR202 cluster bacterium JH1073]
MVRAIFNGTVVAESEDYEVVEGNVYFPPDSLKREFFSESGLNTRCPWKGTASYYSVDVDGQQAQDVAWYYPSPSDAASNIKDHVAFYPQVVVEG